jgi:hypothetical protein
MGRATWAIAMLAALLLAGCGGKDNGAGQVALGDGSRISLDLPEEQQPAVDDIRGAVSGVVVNEAIFPLPGAIVAVRDRDHETTTDADGRFAFLEMPPGLYTLTVTIEGYGDGLGTVNVKSGQVVKSILQVRRMPVLDPYHTTIKVETVHDPANAILYGFTDQLVAFDMQPKTVILEAKWDGLTDTPVADLLEYEVQPESDPETYQTGGGPNPLRVQFDADFFPKGEYAVRFNVHPSAYSSPGETRGQVFLTIFYVDPAPEGWSLVAGDL